MTYRAFSTAVRSRGRAWTAGVVAVALLAFMGLATTSALSAPISLFTDGFETGSVNDAWDNAEAGWTVVDNPAGAHSGDDRGQVAGPVTDSELFKNVDTTGYQDITLTFWYLIDDGLEVADTFDIEWSSDAGSTWNTLDTLTDGDDFMTDWDEWTMVLPGGANDNATFAFRFNATLDGGTDIVKIDDVLITGEEIPAPTTGTITIVKDAVPADGTDFAFTSTELGGFTLDDDADADGTYEDTEVFGALAEGTYSVTESAVVDWTLSDLSCTGDDESGITIVDNTVTIDLVAGEDVVCTFTNTEENAPDTDTVVVTGDTSAGENQPGWLFNRDPGTATPYAFNDMQASIGDGSVYILPIDGGSPSDKFIGELFLLDEIADIDEISYDFRIGDGGDSGDANHFYMNVYANFGESDPTKFYDCRYNIVPSTGSTGSFTTVTFDPTQSYPVTTRTGAAASPHACPSVPADMDGLSTGSSTIRVIALNVGDTSANDADLDGYYDKVVVSQTDLITTYDFEPAEEEPVECLVEGYKYDVMENPLAGWTIGLRGYGDDTTDSDGYYCIEGEIETPEDEYVVYEEMETSWEFHHVTVNGVTDPDAEEIEGEVEVVVDSLDDLVVNFYNRDLTEPEVEYGAYCGDGEVNQEWEQCDAGLNGGDVAGRACNAQCQWKDIKQCKDLILAQVVIEDSRTEGVAEFVEAIYVGGDEVENTIPAGAWFPVYLNGEYFVDLPMASYQDVPGLAVRREEGTVKTRMYAMYPKVNDAPTGKEHVTGYVAFSDNVDAINQASQAGSNKVEKPFNGTGVGEYNGGDDELWLEGGISYFWMTAGTGKDGFITYYSEFEGCEYEGQCLLNEKGVIAEDTFSRGPDSTTLGDTEKGGYTWKYYGGSTWGVIGGEAYKVSGGGNQPIAYLDTDVSDFSMEVRLTNVEAEDYASGLAFRISDPENFLYLKTDHHGAYILMKRSQDPDTDVITIDQLASSNTQPENGDVLRVTTVGDIITVYVNGTLLFSTTESFNSDATMHGLYGSYWTDGHRFDDFVLSEDDASCEFEAYDYGDAPDETVGTRQFPTRAVDSGAYHAIVPGFFLGSGVDADADGYPHDFAIGDDTFDGNDDEDGVVFTSDYVAGATTTLDVTASEEGYLDAWVDFNDDGNWDDVGEQIFVAEPLVAGVNALEFSVPAFAETVGDGVIISRFRFSSTGDLPYDGGAGDGEVEDYAVRLSTPENACIIEGHKYDETGNPLEGWTIGLGRELQCAPEDAWADEVVSFTQGVRNNGTAVLPERSDASQALGIAENDDTFNFVSLGFGGEIVLRFDEIIVNGSGDDIEVVETGFGNPSDEEYPETAEVYASQDGETWEFLGTDIQDGTFDLGSLEWAQYVRIVDVSDPEDFNDTADGFDVDGVRAITCGESETLATTVTDANGYYCFDETLEPGQYVVYEELQEGWEPLDVQVNDGDWAWFTDSFFDVFVEMLLDEEDRMTVDFYNTEVDGGSTNPEVPQCSDGSDNDSDELVDAEDPGCWTDPEDASTYDPNDDDETDVIVDINIVSSDTNSTGTRRRGGDSNSGAGEVLGETITVAEVGDPVCPYLTSYLHKDRVNPVDQMMRLKLFLNVFEGASLNPMDATFNEATFDAVVAYQLKNQASVLDPWTALGADDTPTGYVYQLTQWHINNTVCPGTPYPGTLVLDPRA